MRAHPAALACQLVLLIAIGVAANRLPTDGLPLQHPTTPAREGPLRQDTPRIDDAYRRLPLAFEENRGQTESQVKFISRGAGYTLYLGPTQAVLVLGPRSPSVRSSAAVQPPAVLTMTLAGATPAPPVSGLEEQPGKVNYFIGDDPEEWHTNVPTYARVRYSEVYPRIDLVYYGNQRQLEYDFIVKPGGDPTRIGLDFQGADQLRIDDRGDLVVQSQGEEIRMRRASRTQQTSRRPIRSRGRSPAAPTRS